MPKKTDQPQETKPELTEWQKRNLEFLQKKQEREEEKKRLEEAERKQAQLQAVADLETDREEGTFKEEPKDSELSGKAEEKKTKKSWLSRWRATSKKVNLTSVKSRKDFLRGFGVGLLLLASILTLLLSIFMISPYSTTKVVAVSGESQAKAADIKSSARISDTSYITDLIFNPIQHEKAVVDGNVWVKSAKISYSFPNKFIIKVTEHNIVAYADTDGAYTPILEDGSLVTGTKVDSLPDGALVINLTDEKYLKTFLTKMTKLELSLISEIQTIDLANSKSTTDLLLVTMKDGNTVRVPLSELDKKLPYYNKISKNLVAPSIVDMEVGIYTTNAAIEEALAASKSKKTEDEASDTTSSDAETSVEESESDADASSGVEEVENTDTTVLDDSVSSEE
ncbi:cell division protein FtsQ/DivIB [Streptococcus caprae]|uniref:Cell division protein DivIB n=1 Tax=Streptococcus caprae TaxID=1640501 RepID=A0ABV8CVY5_9STRE